MEDKLKKISEYLLLPGAIVALIAGLISIYKDTGWYIYIPLLIITVVLIIVFFLKNKEGVIDDELVYFSGSRC